jgi:colicin import membrane protein
LTGNSARQSAEYQARIRAKIKANIVVPPDISGNPEAVFDVVQLPTGEVLGEPRLVKSSGHRGYDEAVLRAILKSQPLPRPERPELFVRELRLNFTPRE